MAGGVRGGRGAVVLAAVAVALVLAVVARAAGFTIVPAPNPGTANTISGLVAFSPTDIWGVGTVSSSTYAGCHGRTLLSHWTGSPFVEVPSGTTPVCAAINGVTGSSASDIWAVGSVSNARETHLRHWNGTAWTIVPGATIPAPAIGRAQRSTELNATVAVGSNDVWAVGRAEYADFNRRSVIEHWNGSAWQLIPGPTAVGTVLYGVTALGSANAWAVGVTGSATLATHWNGSSWTAVATPNVNVINTLRGVSGASANDVWAVGSSIKNPNDGVSAPSTLIEHWNGAVWSVVPSPNVGTGGNALLAVSARSAKEAWAVGYDDSTGSFPVRHTLVLRWDGTRWSVVSSPNAGTGDNWLTQVIASAGATDVWALGTSANGTVVERFIP